MTNTFLLTWNPNLWPWPDADFEDVVSQTAAGELAAGQWSVGVRRHGIAIGDRAFLLRQHVDRGIVASGYFTSEIFWDGHWDGTDRDTTYAMLEWDVVLHPEDRLSVETLERRLPAVAWNRFQGSGIQLKPDAASRLEQVWKRHVDGLVYRSPEEATASETYIEGSVTQVLVNRYERDHRARERCIEHHGTSCAVCGFDFERTYGAIGRGFIHVHHLRDLADINKRYQVDPVKDLRPVCPNCHAMLHRQRPALTTSALKRRLRKV